MIRTCAKFACVLTVVELLLCSPLFAGNGSESEKQTSAKKPNVIFILADDSGFSDLGCYGSSISTPHLDSLAADGLKFTQFYNTGRCWPTRASLMTGFYPQQVHRDALPNLGGGGSGKRQAWARLLPDFLKPHRYRSYHSGKWHIDGTVLATGFDRSLNIINQGNYFTNKQNQIDDKEIKPAAIRAEDSGYYTTTATIDHAIDCLKEHSEEYSDRPFFSYVAFIAPHFPLHAQQQDIDKYANEYLDGWETMRNERFKKQLELGLHNTTLSQIESEVGPPYDFPDALEKLGPGEVNRPLPWADLTDEQKKFQSIKMQIHAAMIDRMDVEIGRLVDFLKKTGELENTVIFFASDNGASAEIMVRNGGHDPNALPGSAASYLCLGPGFSSACNTPFRRHKTWVHEGGISSPLIVHWPAGIKSKGELRHTPSHMIDLLPTVFDLTGIEKPKEWKGEAIPTAPGKSLVPTFESDVTIERECMWWLHGGNRAVRVGDYKLVASKGNPWELYDMSSDRAETNNLIKTHPEKAQQLEAVWDSQLEEISNLAKKTIMDQPKRRKKKPKSSRKVEGIKMQNDSPSKE